MPDALRAMGGQWAFADGRCRPPLGGWRLISADPAWHFRARTVLTKSNWVSRRDAEKHYPVMDLDDIKALPVPAMAAEDCHLFLWVTGPILEKAFEVIRAWGFRYSAIAFDWIKLKRNWPDGAPVTETDLHVGLGLTTRKNAEYCLLARRGNAKRLSRDVRAVIFSPRREHSRKPDDAFARMRRYAAGPYLELFARTRRPGWDCWGNQLDKFDAGHKP